MKVKELIHLLQEEDPTGELEACVGNIDIHFVEKQPAYYDGRLQILKRDPKRTGKCYDIDGAEITGDGYKVQIHILSIQEALREDPGLSIIGSSEDLERVRKIVC